jgi:uncharacterized protein (TIGR00369 family)
LVEKDPIGTPPPAAVLLGREFVSFDDSAGTAELRFLARPEFRNRRGHVQGGMLAAMLDSTLAAPLLRTLADGESIVTIEMKVSYVRPAAVGPILASGRIVERGRSIAFLAGELRNEAGGLIAAGTGTFRILKAKREV